MEVVDTEEDIDLSSFLDEAFINHVCERFFKTIYYQFVTEAFNFYSANANAWKACEPDPLYDLLGNGEFFYFTKPVRQAVVTLAYVFRGTHRRYLQQRLPDPRNIEQFIKLVLDYSVNTDEKVFYFLFWIAYVFELNLYCKIHKTGYEGISKSCFSTYPGLSYFKLCMLQHSGKACNWISSFYTPLIKAFDGKYPSCNILLPITHAVGIVARECENNVTFLKIVLLHNAVGVNCEILELKPKFQALAFYEPGRIVLGYKTRSKIKLQDQTKRLSKKSSEIVRNLHLTEETTQESTESSLDASPRNMTPNHNSPLEFDDSRAFFVVTDRYLLKRQEARHNAPESEFKRGIKFFSADNGKMRFVENAMNVLEENIEKNNLYKITDGVFAVYPKHCDNEDYDKIIVLDTSSDDDDDNPQLPPDQHVFMHSVIHELRKYKYCVSNDNEQLKRKCEKRKNIKYEVQCKPLRHEALEINMQNTGAIPKEMNLTEQNHEISKKKKRGRKKKQKKGISMESTEAKPQEINSTEPNFETTKAIWLLENAREDIPMNNIDAEKNNSIEQTPEKGIGENTLLTYKLYEKVLERSISKELASADTRQENISEIIVAVKGEKSIGQNLEKSESTIANAQQEEILNQNVGAVPKIQKPPKEYKNSSKQSPKKSNTAFQTIHPGTEDEDVMKTMEELIKKMQLIFATNTGAKGENSIGQNLEKSELAIPKSQQEEISNRNAGAIPKKQKPSKEHNYFSEQSPEKSNTAFQTNHSGTEDEDVTKSMQELIEKMQLISATSTEATGENSIGQNLEKSELTIPKSQQEEISNQNAGAIPKKQKPSKEHNFFSEQSPEKSNTAFQTIHSGTEDEDVTKSMEELIEKMQLIPATSTEATGENSVGQNLEKSESENEDVMKSMTELIEKMQLMILEYKTQH